jgi:Cu-Zn family superoxide dismutase
MKTIMLAVAMVCLLGAGLPAQAQHREAVAEIRGCTDPTITGRARLIEIPSREGVKQVIVDLVVSGLSDGEHAVHIHETANCDPCAAAGGHFDPGPNGNPSPDGNHPFHSGDLININVYRGDGVLFTQTSRVTLAPGPLSLFDADGSAFIIHDNPDTYCPDGAVTGCAGGGRAACGIIVPVEE